MDEKSTPWHELPFYRSLSEQILLLGAPKEILILNALAGLLFIVNFHFWLIIPLNLAVHFGCIYVAKNDSQFFDCIREYAKKKNYYCT
jgi:type IV secretory pathway TrbD component